MHLTPGVVSAYWAETEKIALTVKQLNQAVRRINPANPKGIVKKVGPVTIPTEAQNKLLHKMHREGTLPEGFMAAQPPRELLDALAYHHPNPGTIVVGSKNQASQGFRGYTVEPLGRRPKSVLRGISTLHEAAERGVRAPRLDAPGHLSLARVVGNDLNIMKRLSGPGSEKAKRVFNAYREQEYGVLRDRAVKKFGPRAARYFDPNNPDKIPKRMIKILDAESPGYTLADLQAHAGHLQRLKNSVFYAKRRKKIRPPSRFKSTVTETPGFADLPPEVKQRLANKR